MNCCFHILFPRPSVSPGASAQSINTLSALHHALKNIDPFSYIALHDAGRCGFTTLARRKGSYRTFCLALATFSSFKPLRNGLVKHKKEEKKKIGNVSESKQVSHRLNMQDKKIC